jgi:hypothetical protein
LVAADQLPVTVVASDFLLDAIIKERTPMIALKRGTDVQHVPRSLQRPAHPTSLHPILDQVATRTFDHAGGNGVTLAS